MDDRFASLDGISRAMLQMAAVDGHVRLWRLRRIGHFATDMQTLLHIQQSLNPAYQRATGRLALEFHMSRTDPETGQVVNGEWWFADEDNREGMLRHFWVDLIREEDSVTVLAQLPEVVLPAEVVLEHNLLAVTLRRNPAPRTHQFWLDVVSEERHYVVLMRIPVNHEPSIELSEAMLMVTVRSASDHVDHYHVVFPGPVGGPIQWRTSRGHLEIIVPKRWVGEAGS